MKTTGSRTIPRYELYGCVPISPGTPSFGLPVFRSASGAGFGQVVDELTGRIADFRSIDLDGVRTVPVLGTSLFRVNESPAYCLLKSDQLAVGGSIGAIRPELERITNDAAVSLPVRLQAAALVSPPEERRLRRIASCGFDLSEQAAVRAYNRSLGRIILWEKLLRAARSTEVAERTLHLRPQIDLDFTVDGAVKLHLNVITATDYPSLNFNTLAASIEIELGVTAPSNDETENREEEGALSSITPSDLKSYLEHTIGSDARISLYTYTWTTELLKSLGFKNIDQLDTAVAGYSSRQLSYVATGNLQGQTTKLELLLLASMGEKFIQRHPWARNPWFVDGQRDKMAKFTKSGIKIGTFDPLER